MEKSVEFVSQSKASCLGYKFVISIIELCCESAKHPSYGQFKLVMTIERSWVKDDWSILILSSIARPEISVK